ncbi:MAG TPA: WD40 repeat domain-containing protein [Ktedonobacteraceae bacterium]|nr:WD40 repeat domain-containing protein [Ktedonobacteraceae bacterium]
MQQSTERLSRRVVLQSLAGFVVAMSIEGCAQSTASSPAPTSTPRAHGRVLVTYRGHKMRVTTIAWSPDSKYIASGSLDKTVQIWAASTSDHFHPFIYRGHSAAVNTIDWSPDSRRVVSGSSDKTVQIWDALTGENLVTGRGHTDAVTAVAWSPDGRSIASSSADGTVRLWDATTGIQKYVYRGHTDSVSSLSWSPDSLHLASASSDKTIQIQDVTSGKHIFTYRGHSATVSSVSWAPDGKRIASGSWDKTVQVWDAATGKLAYTYEGYNVKEAQASTAKGVLPDLIFIVAWSHNGKRIAAVTQVYCGDTCGVVVSWDADTQRNVAFYIDTPVFALAWSPDDTRFVSSTEVSTQGTETMRGPVPQDGSYAQISQA